MTTIVAMDPGLHGGIVATDEHGACLLAERTPLAHGSFDPVRAAELLAGLPRPIIGCIEKPAAHGRFKGGRRAGPDSGYLAVKANVAAWRRCATFQLVDVAARTWQAAVLGRIPPGHAKASAIAWCQRFAPDVELMPGRCTTVQDGISDARCMVEWLRRIHKPSRAVARK